MRILILSQWYAPEPAQLITGLAETLNSLNHDVTVLTGFPNYPSGKLYPGYRVKLWQREVVQGVHVVRVPLYPSHDKSALKRSINYLSFAFFTTLLGPLLVRRPHVIHVYHPPLTTAISGWLLSLLFRVPLTLEVQDLWPDSLVATGMVRNQRILGFVGRIAQWCYRRATSIRVISSGMKRALEDRGVPAHKIHVIPNWTEECNDHGDRSKDPATGPHKSPGDFTIMFAGNIGIAQALDTVLAAASLLRDSANLQIVIVGDGVEAARLQSIVQEHRLTNIRFLGWQPREEMPRLFEQADVLLVSLADDPLFRSTIPHKVYSYMASGRPVLVVADGDAADTVTSVGAGVACRPGDPVALAETIRQLQQMSPHELAELGNNGRRAVKELYSRERVAGRVASWIESVA